MMIPGRHLRLFLCLLLVAVGSFHLSARNLDEIKRSGKIYVAFTSDDLKNINYELAQEFARYLNVELIEVKIDWEEVFMQNGDIPEDLETNPDLNYTPDALRKADIICSTFTVIQWRKKLFGFAETLQSAELLMVRKDQSLPRGLEDLSGKTVAYVRSTTIEDRIKEINATLGGTLKLLPVESTQEAQSLIQQGKAYGIVLDADEALNFNAQSNQQFHIAFPVSDISKTAWATEKNNALIREVENYFETVASNGVLDEIFYRRFGITYSTYVDRLAKNLRLENLHRDLDDILASGKLVVALRERNFIYRENGQKQFMHALAEEFADYLGVSLEFVVTPYFGKYWEATDGQVYRDSSYTPDWFNYFDLACETIAPLDWRQNKVNTIPVYPSSYTVIARKETPILKLEDLKNLRGVTGPQTVYEDILRENGISNFYYAEMVNDYIPAVDRGDADYTIIYDAFYELSAHPGLEVKLDLGELNVSWALRKDQPDLEAEVRTFLARSQKQGLIGTLMKALRGNTLQAPEAFINSYYESFQTGQLPYVNYGADDGLPQEDIFSIFQDQKGYLWFGTNSGAVRYNGREMVVFNQDQGLPGNSVRDIQQDSSGVMYFATTNGIAKFARDTTVQVLLEGLSFSEVFIDSRNRHWFLGDNGVYRETRDGKIVFLNSAHPVLPDVVYHMTEDPRTGNLLLATVRGVYLVDPDGQSMDQLSNQDAYSLFIDVNDSLWISTRDGLYITHLHELQENRNWWTGRNLNRSLHFPVDIISDISSNKYGSVWLVSDSRILQVTSTDQQPIIYEQEIGIKNNKILSFLIDQEDNLWIGFSGGLQRLTNRKGLRNFYPGTIDSYIYSLMQDRMDRIWVASDNGVFHFQNNQLTNFSALHGLETNKFATALLPNGNVLLAHDEGLLEVEASSLRILRRMTFPNLVHSLENVFVTGKGEIFLLSGIHGVIYYLSSMDALPVPETTHLQCVFS
ncbi:MAG: transporter substrate-binding domain-containing protein [Bacteroidales bacterium]